MYATPRAINPGRNIRLFLNANLYCLKTTKLNIAVNGTIPISIAEYTITQDLSNIFGISKLGLYDNPFLYDTLIKNKRIILISGFPSFENNKVTTPNNEMIGKQNNSMAKTLLITTRNPIININRYELQKVFIFLAIEFVLIKF